MAMTAGRRAGQSAPSGAPATATTRNGAVTTESRSTRRSPGRTAGSREVDQIECGACDLNWPYEQYRNLTLIWVRDDEMEREKLQKQLDTEKSRRELVEWLLAKREWQSVPSRCQLSPPPTAYAEFYKSSLTDSSESGSAVDATGSCEAMG
jgi:hypothetical protein